MLRPHFLLSALLLGGLVFSADVHGQDRNTSRENRRDSQTETKNGRKDTSSTGMNKMEFEYDQVAQLKDRLLDSKLIQQANKEYETNKDELAKKIACEIIVQVLSEDRLFVATLKDKLMDEHEGQVSQGDMEDMHERIHQQKEMIMKDQKEFKDLLGKVVMRCKVEEKLMQMMNEADEHDNNRQARMESRHQQELTHECQTAARV